LLALLVLLPVAVVGRLYRGMHRQASSDPSSTQLLVITLTYQLWCFGQSCREPPPDDTGVSRGPRRLAYWL
jgi:hypothetical protein